MAGLRKSASHSFAGRLWRFLFRPASKLEIASFFAVLALVVVDRAVARVTVRNDSELSLTSVSISGTGFARRVPTLPPGSSYTFWFVPSGDSSVELSFSAAGRNVDAGGHGYFTAPPRPQLPGTISINTALEAGFGYTPIVPFHWFIQ